jgi:hypothetical protein
LEIKDINWLELETESSKFKDKRLNTRFKNLIDQIWSGIGKSIPFACQDWANTKAAYRFFSNKRISEEEILEGHFQSTKDRFSKTEGPIFILQDTTEFSYHREKPELVGSTRIIKNGRAYGHPKFHTICGLLMHSSLAVTKDGLPLGLTAIKFWTRKKLKGRALAAKINATRIPIEQKESIRWLENVKNTIELLGDPKRCIHIGDRENDIYEFFCLANELKTNFLVRSRLDRLCGKGEHTVLEDMDSTEVKGLHRVKLRDKEGKKINVVLELKYKKLKILPPEGKKKWYPEISVTVLHAVERNKPKDRERINWKLLTNIPVASRSEAIEKINWYTMRWKIETFHKILKSGCKAEESKLRTAEGLTKLISIFCILSWRIFWMTMINRLNPKESAEVVLTENEISLLDKIVKDKKHFKNSDKNISYYLLKIAKLGGYLARTSDPPPGNMVVWRGLTRLIDIELGFNMAQVKNCG